MSDVSVHPGSPYSRPQSLLSLQTRVYHKPPKLGSHPISGNAPSWRSDQHCQGFGFFIPGSDGNNYTCSPGLVGPNPGLSSMPSSGHRVAGVLPYLVTLCMYHLHPLSTLLRDHFGMRVDHSSKLISLSSPVIRLTLEFWSRRDVVSHGVPLQPLPRSHNECIHLWMGKVCGPLTAMGVWSSD